MATRPIPGVATSTAQITACGQLKPSLRMISAMGMTKASESATVTLQVKQCHTENGPMPPSCAIYEREGCHNNLNRA